MEDTLDWSTFFQDSPVASGDDVGHQPAHQLLGSSALGFDALPSPPVWNFGGVSLFSHSSLMPGIATTSAATTTTSNMTTTFEQQLAELNPPASEPLSLDVEHFAQSHKRAASSSESDSPSDEQSLQALKSGGGGAGGAPGVGRSKRHEGPRRHSRGSRACIRCRKQKMRCLNEDGGKCERCQHMKADCVYAEEEHRPRRKSMASESGTGRRPSVSPDMAAKVLELPTPSPSVETTPVMSNAMTLDQSNESGLKSANWISDEQARFLVDTFFREVNPCWGLLDPNLQTPQYLRNTSPLLFLTVCTVASRYVNGPLRALYQTLYRQTREDATAVLAQGGPRTVETVQACLILAMWAVHPSGAGQDLGWLLVAFASRLAADLRLQRVSTNTPRDELSQRQYTNRLRTWMLCCALDRSYSLQRGRVPTLSCQPLQVRELVEEIKAKSPAAIGIAGYMELQMIVSEALEGLQNTDGPVDPGAITAVFESRTATWKTFFTQFLNEPSTGAIISLQDLSYFFGIFDFYQHYWSLVVFSFGLQHAIDNKTTQVPYYFFKCSGYANKLLQGAESILSRHAYFRQAPDSRFVFLTYAAVTLIKFSQPAFQHFCPAQSDMAAASIARRVIELAQLLHTTAVDGTHMPSICAAFLRSLVKQCSRARGATSLLVPSSGVDEDEAIVDEADVKASGVAIKPLVTAVLHRDGWNSMVVPGFDGRERPHTPNFLRLLPVVTPV